MFWCGLLAQSCFLYSGLFKIFCKSRTCSVVCSVLLPTTHVSKTTLRLPVVTLIRQTSNSVIFTNILLVYQTILITISWILHFDVVNEVLFTFLLFPLYLLSGLDCSSIRRLVYNFWTWKYVHTINWLMLDILIISLTWISAFARFSWLLSILIWSSIVVCELWTTINSISANE